MFICEGVALLFNACSSMYDILSWYDGVQIFRVFADEVCWFRWQGSGHRTKRSSVQTVAEARKSQKYFILYVDGYFWTYDIDFRYSIQYVNTWGMYIWDTEVGGRFIGVRFVAPVIKANQFFFAHKRLTFGHWILSWSGASPIKLLTLRTNLQTFLKIKVCDSRP